MKINWKVRMQHKQFWVAMVALLVVLANQIATVFTMDITIISEQLTGILETVLMILALMGIVIDPTTDGINDSERSLNYDKPGDVGDKHW